MESIALAISSRASSTDTGEDKASPSRSQVVVAHPKRIRPVYCFGDAGMNRASRVALPMQTGRTPVASGSNVPRCPAFLRTNRRRTCVMTSCDVIPLGLSIIRTPFKTQCRLIRLFERARESTDLRERWGSSGPGSSKRPRSRREFG